MAKLTAKNVKFNRSVGTVPASYFDVVLPTYTTNTLIKTISNPNHYSTETYDYFGRFAIAENTNYLFIDAVNEDSSNPVADSGVVYVFDKNNDYSLHTTIVNPTPNTVYPNNEFGRRIIANDTYIAISDPFKTLNGSGQGDGVVHIYNAADFSLKYTIQNPDSYPSVDDRFGLGQLAINGSTLLVGTPYEDSVSDTSTPGDGAVYVFDLSSPTPSLIHTFPTPTPNSPHLDQFGMNVAVDNSYIVITAHGSTVDNIGGYQGKVYVYDASTYQLIHTIDNPNMGGGNNSGDAFGATLAYENGKIFTIAREDYSPNVANALYIIDVATANIDHYIPAPDMTAGYYFGGWDGAPKLSASGKYVAVGLTEYNTQSGRVYIYDFETGTLVMTIDNPNAYSTPDNDAFGQVVHIKDDKLYVSAFTEDSPAGDRSGKTYVFQLS